MLVTLTTGCGLGGWHPEACNQCEIGTYAYPVCDCGDSSQADNPTPCDPGGCAGACIGSHDWDAEAVYCPGPTSGPSYCERWDPADDITVVGSVHEVDAGLVSELMLDPTPLWECDSAVFTYSSTVGFQVANAAAGDTLYELGLRNGDVMVALNGYSLGSEYEVWLAIIALWYVVGETDYALEIERSAASVTLTYDVLVS